MTSQERLELCANIKFCMELGETPTDTYKKLQRTRGENAVFRALFFLSGSGDCLKGGSHLKMMKGVEEGRASSRQM
jgi:hypothetical protein